MKDCNCAHCHTPFTPTSREKEFCCGGCRFVNQLLLGEGLNDFYKLQDGQTGRPVGERPFEAAKTDWLESLISQQEPDAKQHRLKLRISGVTCVGCVWLIERLFLAQPGAVCASVFPATAEAEFTWEAGSDALLSLARDLPRYGYVLEDPAHSGASAPESAKLIPKLGLSAAFAMNTMAFSLPRYLGMKDSFPYAGLFDLIALLSSTFALLIGGTYFFAKALAALRHRTIHIDLPIALGLAAAYGGSIIGWLNGEAHLIYFDFVATFTVLMLGGRYLHLAAAERAQNQLQGQSAIPRDLTLADGSRKATTALTLDDQFQLPPGQALPVSATLLSESQEFSLAWMTGEPEPRLFQKGASIPAGAVPLGLGRKELNLRASEDYLDSLVARLTSEESRHTSPPAVQQVLKFYLLTIIVIGIGTGIGGVISGVPPLIALQRMISVFIVSCPCAIGVAIPLVDRRAASAMARIGVFIQNPALWTPLIRLKHLIFDKTGTLTLENPELIQSHQITRLSTEARHILHHLTAQSLHPLSRALRFGELPPPDQALEITHLVGLGSALTLDGHQWTLGKPGWRGQTNFETLPTETLACELARDGTVIETFTFRETLRPRALQALSSLSQTHTLHILSGDQQPRVSRLAESLGIPAEQAHAALDPDQKAALVRSLQPSLYLGDGMNDTLAFSAATISGTPVADRSLLDRRSDFLFTCPGLSFLPTLFSIARWRRQTVGLILAFTITYNLAAVTACVLGHMTPLAAAILMPLSSIASLLIARRRTPNQQSPRATKAPHSKKTVTKALV